MCRFPGDRYHAMLGVEIGVGFTVTAIMFALYANLASEADSRKDFDPMGEGSIVSELLLERLNYCIYVILLMIGLWAMSPNRT